MQDIWWHWQILLLPALAAHRDLRCSLHHVMQPCLHVWATAAPLPHAPSPLLGSNHHFCIRKRLQGIALQVDPSYSIVKECFPYLSKRLLTDDNPRVRAALKQLLFAGQDHISLERLEKLFAGISTYDVEGLRGQDAAAQQVLAARGGSAAGAGASGVPAPAQPLLDSTAKEVLAAVFSERPTYVQELLVEEAASTVDAAARQLASLLLGPLLQAGGARAAVASSGLRGTGAPLPPALALLDRWAWQGSGRSLCALLQQRVSSTCLRQREQT